MGLSPTERGFLEQEIDNMIPRLADNWKDFRGSKSEFIWFMKGVVWGGFYAVLRITHKGMPDGEQTHEAYTTLEKRFQDFEDKITDLPDH